MADKKENSRRISIESDGTFEGTTVTIDGKSIGGGSKKLDSVAFMAEGPFDANTQESFFRFRASTKEKDGDTERISTIRISNNKEGDMVAVINVTSSSGVSLVVGDSALDEILEVVENEEKKESEDAEDTTEDTEDTTEDKTEDSEEPTEDESKKDDKVELTPYQRKMQEKVKRAEGILKG